MFGRHVNCTVWVCGMKTIWTPPGPDHFYSDLRTWTESKPQGIKAAIGILRQRPRHYMLNSQTWQLLAVRMCAIRHCSACFTKFISTLLWANIVTWWNVQEVVKYGIFLFFLGILLVRVFQFSFNILIFCYMNRAKILGCDWTNKTLCNGLSITYNGTMEPRFRRNCGGKYCSEL